MFFLIKLIGVTLVCKTVQVSGVQVSNTSSAYRIVFSPLKVKSLIFTIYLSSALAHLPHLLSLWQSPNCSLCLGDFFLNSFPFFTQPSSPPPLKQLLVSFMYWLICFCFVSLFYSLDSKYKWNLLVFVFLWLAYFT